MTGFLLGAILAVGLAAVAEGYAIFGRMQLFLTAAEQILGALQVPLRDVPSKSAPRSVAPADIRPRPWFQTLRRLAAAADHLEEAGDEPVVEDQAAAVDDALARWADDGGRTPVDEGAQDDVDDAPTDVFPALDPATVPTGIDIAAGLRLNRLTPDDDAWRDRFTFAAGGRRAASGTHGGD